MGEETLQPGELGMSDLVQLGDMVSTHGIRGFLRLRLFNSESRALENTSEVFLSKGRETLVRHEVVSARRSRHFLLVKLRHSARLEDAQSLVGCKVFVRKATLPELPEREYYHYQLEGLLVVTSDGVEIGRVDRVLHTRANDVLVARSAGTEHLIPLVAEIVRQVDLGERRIVVTALDGLLD